MPTAARCRTYYCTRSHDQNHILAQPITNLVTPGHPEMSTRVSRGQDVARCSTPPSVNNKLPATCPYANKRRRKRGWANLSIHPLPSPTTAAGAGVLNAPSVLHQVHYAPWPSVCGVSIDTVRTGGGGDGYRPCANIRPAASMLVALKSLPTPRRWRPFPKQKQNKKKQHDGAYFPVTSWQEHGHRKNGDLYPSANKRLRVPLL